MISVYFRQTRDRLLDLIGAITIVRLEQDSLEVLLLSSLLECTRIKTRHPGRYKYENDNYPEFLVSDPIKCRQMVSK